MLHELMFNLLLHTDNLYKDNHTLCIAKQTLALLSAPLGTFVLCTCNVQAKAVSGLYRTTTTTFSINYPRATPGFSVLHMEKACNIEKLGMAWRQGEVLDTHIGCNKSPHIGGQVP